MLELYKNIKNRREELGLSQQELADLLGYKSRSTIAKIESGENDIPQSKIMAFAEALQTTPGKLMGWSEERENKFIEERLDGEYISVLHELNPSKITVEIMDVIYFLNETGKQKVLEYAKDLVESGKYK